MRFKIYRVVQAAGFVALCASLDQCGEATPYSTAVQSTPGLVSYWQFAGSQGTLVNGTTTNDVEGDVGTISRNGTGQASLVAGPTAPGIGGGNALFVNGDPAASATTGTNYAF